MRRRVVSGAMIFGFLGLLVFAGVLMAKNYNAHKQLAFRLQPFTLYSRHSALIDGQPQDQVATIVRYVRGDGAWKELKTRSDGSHQLSFGIPGKGVFRVDEKNKELVYLSAMATDRASVAAGVKTGKVDYVLGIPTIVSREDRDDGSYFEAHHAPTLGGTMLKLLAGDKHITNITEATSIVLGEPRASEFASLPDYPISHAAYEEKMKAAQ